MITNNITNNIVAHNICNHVRNTYSESAMSNINRDYKITLININDHNKINEELVLYGNMSEQELEDAFSNMVIENKDKNIKYNNSNYIVNIAKYTYRLLRYTFKCIINKLYDSKDQLTQTIKSQNFRVDNYTKNKITQQEVDHICSIVQISESFAINNTFEYINIFHFINNKHMNENTMYTFNSDRSTLGIFGRKDLRNIYHIYNRYIQRIFQQTDKNANHIKYIPQLFMYKDHNKRIRRVGTLYIKNRNTTMNHIQIYDRLKNKKDLSLSNFLTYDLILMQEHIASKVFDICPIFIKDHRDEKNVKIINMIIKEYSRLINIDNSRTIMIELRVS